MRSMKSLVPRNVKRLIKYLLLFGIAKTFRIYRLTSNRAQKIVQMPLPDSDSFVWLRPSTSDLNAFNEVFLDRGYNIPISFIPQNIVDVGANVGYTSVFFAYRFPSARIFAIEPDRSNLELLKKNVAMFPNVTVIHAGLWHKRSRLRVQNPKAASYSFRLCESEQEEGSIEAITMERILSLIPERVIDVLKIDIEGAEKEILERSADWIRRVKMIIIELHDRYNPGCSEAMNRVASFWARVRRRTDLKADFKSAP